MKYLIIVILFVLAINPVLSGCDEDSEISPGGNDVCEVGDIEEYDYLLVEYTIHSLSTGDRLVIYVLDEDNYDKYKDDISFTYEERKNETSERSDDFKIEFDGDGSVFVVFNAPSSNSKDVRLEFTVTNKFEVNEEGDYNPFTSNLFSFIVIGVAIGISIIVIIIDMSHRNIAM